MKRILSKIPGFRTGVLWKKIISTIIHILLILFLMLIFSDYPSKSSNSGDNLIDYLFLWLYVISLIIVPYIICTNIFGLRSKLLFFRKKTVVGYFLGFLFASLVIFIGIIIGSVVLSNFYSDEYKAVQDINYKNVQQIKLQQKEDKRQAELIAKEKEEAEKEAKKIAKLQNEEKEKLEEEAKEQEKLDAKAIAQAEEEAKKQEKQETEAKANAEKEAQKQAVKKVEVKSSNAADKEDESSGDSMVNRFFSWLGNIGKEANSTGTDIFNESSNIAKNINFNNKYVDGVRNSQRQDYFNITYGEAFDSFFANPSWQYFLAENGQRVVEFSGKCTYADTVVEARIQFIISQDETYFEVGAMGFNNVPQNAIMTNALINAAFENAASK